MDIGEFVVSGRNFKLKDYGPGSTGKYKDRAEAERKMAKDLRRLNKLQEMLYAQNTQGVLLVFQAMDAAGKDSTVKHVMSGINPAGCQVTSFKAPSKEELDHDYLWRCVKALPERGRIGIFIRSYYEEVLAVRVHPGILVSQALPIHLKDGGIWERRFKEIINFEEYLQANGFLVLKFFLNVSRNEQKKRFIERIEDHSKNWKFSFDDINKRKLWKKYMKAYEDAIGATSSKECPWYIIPADHKWFTRAIVADIIVKRLKELKLEFPHLTAKERSKLKEARMLLEFKTALGGGRFCYFSNQPFKQSVGNAALDIGLFYPFSRNTFNYPNSIDRIIEISNYFPNEGKHVSYRID